MAVRPPPRRAKEHDGFGVESANVIAPLPEPPAVERVTDVPTELVNVVFEIESAACAPRKLKVTGLVTACEYVPSEALVAVTTQLAAALAPNTPLVNVQFVPVTA